MTRTTVFVSYAHADRKWLEPLKAQLKPLERQGKIELWDDTKISAGAVWREEIERALKSAKVAVLLVSADFLASEFISANELPPLLRAARDGGATVLPVIVGRCLFTETTELRDFQAVNDPNRPLQKLGRDARDEVFVRLARSVMSSLNEQTETDSREKPAGAVEVRVNDDHPRPLPGVASNDPFGEPFGLWGDVAEEALRQLSFVEVMSRTPHSVLEKCTLDDRPYVLKATRANLCNLDAMRELVANRGGPVAGARGWRPLAMGTPRAIWMHDNHIWELQHYYEGVSLADIVEQRHAPIVGHELRRIIESLNTVLEVLHDKGLVHRDINPANILMLENGSVCLVDWSFCCREDAEQFTIVTPGYSAPEQKSGNATCASDWYSLGATCFALANGVTLDDVPPMATAHGIGEIKLDQSEFLGWPVDQYFQRLLHPKPSDRPRPWASKNPKPERFNIRRVSQPVRPPSF